jgi:hypothetical protein
MTTQHTTTDKVNFRKTPKFGANRIASLDLAQAVDVTGRQQGDRWMPATATIAGAAVSGFVSKNVLRDPLSDPREALVGECVTQWLRFDRGKRKEFEDDFVAVVGEYWQSINMDLDGLDREYPWSAAFISYAVRKAGGHDGFVYAAAHARYCHAAIRAKLDGAAHPFWGYKIGDHKPQLGDMVCRWRSSRIDYRYASKKRNFKSHCDIVVAIAKDHVLTIGGNVQQSVRHTRYPISARGFLKNEKNVYAVLRNNR